MYAVAAPKQVKMDDSNEKDTEKSPKSDKKVEKSDSKDL